MNEHKRSFLIMLRNGDRLARTLGGEIAQWLEAKGAGATLCEHSVGGDLESCPPPQGRPWDMVLVLGGDGTFIGVARVCLCLGAPLLGLNLGRLGFLAEGAADWQKRLTALMEGAYTLSRRLVLSYTVEREGTALYSGVAVNDVVVGRGDMARLIRLGVRRGAEHVASIRADGLIVSTPTGSTAYGYSAGGPLVHPEMAALCVTPVCPFLGTFSPVVLPPDKELAIEVEEGRAEVRMTVDGQRTMALACGDVVRVGRWANDLVMAQTSGGSYFARLAGKGFFTQR